MLVVFYDADCRVCAWLLLELLRLDRRRQLCPAPIQGREGERALAHMAPEQRLRSWHARDADGHMISGGAAIAPVLRTLPGGAPLAAASARFPRSSERAYRWVAGHRSLLGHAIPRRSIELAPARLERVCAAARTL